MGVTVSFVHFSHFDFSLSSVQVRFQKCVYSYISSKKGEINKIIDPLNNLPLFIRGSFSFVNFSVVVITSLAFPVQNRRFRVLNGLPWKDFKISK